MLIVDAHLDLAYNALRGRDVTKRAAAQSAKEGEGRKGAADEWGKGGEGAPGVGFPDLKFGGVDFVCATLFAEPARGEHAGYHTAEEARGQAQRQLRWYYKQVTDGLMEVVTSPGQVPRGSERPEKLKAVVLMEGADPLRTA